MTYGIKTYPRDTTPWDNGAQQYQAIGKFDKALAIASEAYRLDPKDPYANQNLAGAYMGLNRYDEAVAVINGAQSQNPNFIGASGLYAIAFIRHDPAAMERSLQAVNGKGIREAFLLLLKAEGEYSGGKVRAARETFAKNIDLSKSLGANELAANMLVIQQLLETELGYSAAAAPVVAKAFSIAKDRDTRAAAMSLLARNGDVSAAEKMAEDLQGEFPDDTMQNAVWIPIARAFIESRRNNGAKAAALLDSARPYELGQGPSSSNYYANYTRAQAFLAARDGANAAKEFQTILDHQGVEAVSPMYALSRLGLGRAYALQGDSAKAHTAYQDFLATMKDADPDVPILKQAKSEYAKLQ